MNFFTSPSTFDVHVAPLHPSTTPDMLFTLFMKYGEISQVRIKRDLITHESRGFGYVSFRDFISVSTAIAQTGTQSLFGNRLSVTPKGLTKVVYLVEYPASLNPEWLKSLCEKEGLRPFVTFTKLGRKANCSEKPMIELKFESQEDAGRFVTFFQSGYKGETKITCKAKFYGRKEEKKPAKKLENMLKSHKKDFSLKINGLVSFNLENDKEETKKERGKSMKEKIMSKAAGSIKEHTKEEFLKEFRHIRFKEVKFEDEKRSVELMFFTLLDVQEFLCSENLEKLKRYLEGNNKELRDRIETSPDLVLMLKIWKNHNKHQEHFPNKMSSAASSNSLLGLFGAPSGVNHFVFCSFKVFFHLFLQRRKKS